MLYPPSNLDGNQVLQHAFDESNQRLRVDASLSVSSIPVAVLISHIDDSIRLGDGVNLVTTTTDTGKVGLDVNLINSSPLNVDVVGINAPTITNISIPLANIEQSHVFSGATRKIEFKLRGDAKLKFSFTAGMSGTTYISLYPGSSYILEELDLSGPLTLYFQSTKASEILEILSWA